MLEDLRFGIFDGRHRWCADTASFVDLKIESNGKVKGVSANLKGNYEKNIEKLP